MPVARDTLDRLIFSPLNRSAPYLSIYGVHLVNRRREMVDQRYSGSGGVGGG